MCDSTGTKRLLVVQWIDTVADQEPGLLDSHRKIQNSMIATLTK